MIRQMGAFVNGKVSLGLCWRTAAQPKVAVPHLSGTGFAGHLRSCRRPVSAAWQPSRAENSLACKPVDGLHAEKLVRRWLLRWNRRTEVLGHKRMSTARPGGGARPLRRALLGVPRVHSRDDDTH